jgi:hypothetical protein
VAVAWFAVAGHAAGGRGGWHVVGKVGSVKTILERLARCEREIALAIAESHQPHTEMEHAGILVWEMDWRMERENILAELRAMEEAA